MPYPILPNDSKDTIDSVIKSSRGDDKENRPSLLDKLTLFVATYLYFRYIGKAISTGQTIPKEWLKLDVVKTITKLSTSIHKTAIPKNGTNRETPKKTYKVVDIASGEPVTIQ